MKKAIVYFIALLAFPLAMKAQQESIHKFAPLPYAYDALEPYIDKMTMEIHYDKHHRAYYNNFTTAIKGTDLETTPMEAIFANIATQSVLIRNNAGGYWNHEMFWNCMKPNGGGAPTGKLGDAINSAFGSFNNFKKQFSEAGVKRFGSGWVWLALGSDGKLFINSTANQDNPLMNTEEKRGTPVFCLDVWEHAYYLKYQNKRGDYISAFWNVANWDYASQQYEIALKKIK
jgi:superoxide dismutase, Fe-Mn family